MSSTTPDDAWLLMAGQFAEGLEDVADDLKDALGRLPSTTNQQVHTLAPKAWAEEWSTKRLSIASSSEPYDQLHRVRHVVLRGTRIRVLGVTGKDCQSAVFVTGMTISYAKPSHSC